MFARRSRDESSRLQQMLSCALLGTFCPVGTLLALSPSGSRCDKAGLRPWACRSVPQSAGEYLFKRTIKETIVDNCFGLAAQLAYYCFLSVFPALLVIVALTSVFPGNVLDQILVWFGSFAPPDVLRIVTTQIQLIRDSGHTGLLTFGVLGALWSSSSAMNAAIDTLNRAYGIREARPWWKVQSLAIVLTMTMSIFVLISFTLIVAGPEIAETTAARHGLGPIFEWTWKILQWPVIFLLISEGFAAVYYLAPDVEQRWPWILPGAHLATGLWLLISLGFRFYVTHFGQYQPDVRRDRWCHRDAALVLPVRPGAAVRGRIQLGNRARFALWKGRGREGSWRTSRLVVPFEAAQPIRRDSLNRIRSR